MRIIRGILTASAALLISGTACSPLFGERTPPTPSVTPTAAASPTSTFGPSPTFEPFALNLTPLPTASPLPALELPTQSASEIGPQVWDGLPTYQAESQPNFYFRLYYDPNSWALTTNQFGFPALVHRSLAGCVVAPSAGRGLPLNARVDHELRFIGVIPYQVDTVSVAGTTQFVTYTGGNGVIYTGFEVHPNDHADQCLPAAENVLATLTSGSASEATPAANP